ncbi:hypothetical protein GQ44DRAFT_706171 [Phaeosphaeriaceae sp. PMI808]|nr:hypothetical protein GQ44DRAFT_706171 [Phaeosphaeriaceae sp. PMI808]
MAAATIVIFVVSQTQYPFLRKYSHLRLTQLRKWNADFSHRKFAQWSIPLADATCNNRVLCTPGFQLLHSIISAETVCDSTIAELFSQTSATREVCDTKAKGLVRGKVVPVTVQGNCNYWVYAGPKFEFVAQFHLKPLVLKLEITALAQEIHGFGYRVVAIWILFLQMASQKFGSELHERRSTVRFTLRLPLPPQQP